MFVIQKTVSINGRKCFVVRDHVVAADTGAIDGDMFVSGRQQITPNLKILFVNNNNVTNADNPIGFWQTILANHNFDYSNNFKLSFKISGDSFYISFDLADGITLHNSTSLVDESEFSLVDIDFDNFNKFEIIQTQAQKIKENKRFTKKTLFAYSLVYSLIGASILFYSIYQNNITRQLKDELLLIKEKKSTLIQSINEKNLQMIDFNITLSQRHIEWLTLLQQYVNNIKGKIKLDKGTVDVEIKFVDMDVVRQLAKQHNIDVRIEPDFMNQTAQLSWQFDAGHKP